ncbi:ABC transporter ATP-binding protein [Candidatus Woesebacteria bacterium]|nr:ABC transporter ATP-binding protein [Candidatus Woesebacteria bacterium]
MAKKTGRRIVIDDSSDDVAIRVSGVSKSFRLPHNRQNSIKGSLVNLIGGGDRSYETQEVLRNISFEIKKGEFFGIVGRNGSGKSTLLKMLAGIYKPTSGEITVNGSLTPFIELGVGFNPELTGRENVYMNGALLGFNDHEVDTMYDDIVEFAELERFMDQKLKNYSSGMIVRLAFSIAIRAETEILIMDEVLAVGDAAFQKKCFDVFRDLKERGRTIILVTHDMGNVERFCSSALVIHDGEIVKLTDSHEAATIYSRLNIKDEEAAKALERPNDKKNTKVIKRWGVGGVRVKSLKTFDSKQNSTSILENGKSAKIQISLERSPGYEKTKIVCGIALHTQDGFNVAGPNSMETPIKSSATQVNIELPSLVLAPGEYLLTVAIFNSEVTEPYDFLDRYYKFSVISNHTVHGAIDLEAKWTSN